MCLKEFDFSTKTAQIYGHMGLKMLYKFKAHKDKRYSRLGALNVLLTLSFEGECPSGCVGFPISTI
jgi:hypothetical protein